MELSVGAFVRLRTDPTRAGILQDGERSRAGSRMLPVQFPDGGLAWLPQSALEVVPQAPASITRRFEEGRFADPEWLRRTLARLRVTGRLSDVVYSMEATDTNFYAFQFKPVLKLLNSPTDGLLIADEVGLGKTIEAGLIWTELRARFQSNRLLVLCPKTLCEKWRSELFRRFGVDARIVDASELFDLLFTSDGTGPGFAAIASMQSLRPPRGWSDEEEEDRNEIVSPRQKLARFLDEAAEGEPLLDLLIIDEAHHMRNPETLLHGLARLLNAVASHRVFLSATPIHLRNRDLHSLLRLIDPDTFEYEQTIEELIELNAPIVEARDLLLKPEIPVEDILERLNLAGQYDLLADSSSLRLIREELQKATLDSGRRADLAARLEHVNQLANYVTRTRRRDVEEFRVRRDPKAPSLAMHPDEKEFYDAITEAVRQYAIEQDTSEGFLLSMPQRLLTSSPAAASRYWSNSAGRDSLLTGDDDYELEDIEAIADGSSTDARPLVSRLAALARRMNLTDRLVSCDSKYQLLLVQLRQVWREEPDAKVIVFSSFKPTLNYLRERLLRDVGAGSCELLHGSIREPRDLVLQRFRDNESRKVLLSSEVGSEGVDLQFCWVVVNYDLPWNPMRLEQRIGRVDRLGQQKEMVVVLNLLFEGTIDQRIYDRLYMRLGLGQKALGEFEAVLGQPIRDMTRKLVDPRLSEAQKAEAIEQAAQALEVLKKHEDELEEQAGSLMRHGDYILQSITESRRLHRWLSGDDILVYVRDRLHRSYPGCAIDTSPPGSDTYRIRLSPGATEAFAAFLGRRGLRGTTRLLNGNDQQRYRFDASVVKGNTHVEGISQMHPLVRFAAYLDSLDKFEQPQPVVARLDLRETAESLRKGLYVIGIRRWYANTGDGSVAGSTRIAYSGGEVTTATLLSPEQAERVASAAASAGRLIPNIASDPRFSKAAEVLRTVVLEDLDVRFDEFEEQMRAQVEDRVRIRRRALERHRDAKAQSLMRIRDHHLDRASYHERRGEGKEARQRRSLAEATEGKLRRLDESCSRRLAEIDALGEVVPEVSDVSVLLVEIG
ncbi:MAG: DEAD/DEAH box helicase family protein [Rhizobiaceae bacterium]|nr:DEAD/DEAH box helicase family protein [Rhizobiaceae bacterium]